MNSRKRFLRYLYSSEFHAMHIKYKEIYIIVSTAYLLEYEYNGKEYSYSFDNIDDMIYSRCILGTLSLDEILDDITILDIELR